MFLKAQEAQELHVKFDGSTLEELNQVHDALTEEQVAFAVPVNEELGQTILTFLEVVPQNPGFGLASPTVVLYDKLADKSGDLNIADVRTLQKLLVESKPTTIAQMRAVKNALKDCESFNIKLGRIEETQRLLSQYIVRKEQEAETGLEFSEEDTANVAQMHIVGREEAEAAE